MHRADDAVILFWYLGAIVVLKILLFQLWFC